MEGQDIAGRPFVSEQARSMPEIEPSAEILHKELTERREHYSKLAEYHGSQASQHAIAANACQAALETFNQKAPAPSPGF